MEVGQYLMCALASGGGGGGGGGQGFQIPLVSLVMSPLLILGFLFKIL